MDDQTKKPPQDETRTCVDCAAEFVFTAGEQEFYECKGFTEKPKRCEPCRRRRKQQRAMTGQGGGR